MSDEIKKSPLEDLINFLRSRPQAAKYIPSVLEAFNANKTRLKQLNLDEDQILIHICQILSEEFVVKEERFENLLNLSKQEVRSRLNYLVRKFPNSFSVDRLEEENWMIFITKEGLINV